MNKHFGGNAPPNFDVATAYLLANAANGDASRAAMAGAIWAIESNFRWRPDGDHGPAQLTSWWKNKHPDLIVEGAYDPFTRPANHANRNKTFTGDVTANIEP